MSLNLKERLAFIKLYAQKWEKMIKTYVNGYLPIEYYKVHANDAADSGLC